MKFYPIDTAPRGRYAKTMRDPEYIEPPKILLYTEGGNYIVGLWSFSSDASVGGVDAIEGCDAWVSDETGANIEQSFGKCLGWFPIVNNDDKNFIKKRVIKMAKMVSEIDCGLRDIFPCNECPLCVDCGEYNICVPSSVKANLLRYKGAE